MYYTLEYINKSGDTIARDYFDNLQKALEWFDNMVETYILEQRDTGLFITDSNGNTVTYWIPEN